MTAWTVVPIPGLAARFDGKEQRVFALLIDAEEGDSDTWAANLGSSEISAMGVCMDAQGNWSAVHLGDLKMESRSLFKKSTTRR
jgi:hypothetical protein